MVRTRVLIGTKPGRRSSPRCGRKVGSFGTIGGMSFNEYKTITAGDGELDNSAVIVQIRRYRSHTARSSGV